MVRSWPIHYTPVDTDYFSVDRHPGGGRDARSTTLDDRAAPSVAIVNETLARRIAPDGNVVGHTFRFRDTIITTIVGVARDAKYATLLETTPPFAYFPIAQVWHAAPSLLVKTTGGTERFAEDLRQAVDVHRSQPAGAARRHAASRPRRSCCCRSGPAPS